MSNLRNTKEFREAVLAALGVSEDKDVENEENFKRAILDALEVTYTVEDIKNFEKFRHLIVNEVVPAITEGGGDSDFTTAEVTFVCESTGFEQGFWGAWTYDEGEQSSIQNYLLPPESSPSTATVVLYKGKTVISPKNNKSIEAMTATGDAEVDSKSFDVYITGDCTITYSCEV